MNVWKITAANKLAKTEEAPPAPEEGKVRIRVTKLFLNGTDAALFDGTIRCKYPLIPGRYAVGLVAEGSAVNYLPKGTRVLLHATVPAPDTGTAKKDFSVSDELICGRTADGYMRDLLYLSPRDFTPLPESVSDEHALLLHHVALAKAAADKLGVKKGQHIAVVGANILGILLCQLLIYQQAAPILIDADAARLEFARSCGIYYTMQTDENLLDNIASLTGGRLVSGAVYVTSARRNEPSIPFSVCAKGANVVLCGSRDDFDVNFSEPFRKEISVYCVSGRSENLEASINLIIRGAVDVTPFSFRTVRADDTEAFLRDYARSYDHDFKEINVVTLI